MLSFSGCLAVAFCVPLVMPDFEWFNSLYRSFCPDYVCRAGETCAAFEEILSKKCAWNQWRWEMDIPNYVQNPALEREVATIISRVNMTSTSNATVLVLGANKLKQDRESLVRYKPMASRMYFLEPNPLVHDGLHHALKDICDDLECKVIEAAICERDIDNVTLYRDRRFWDAGRGMSEGLTSSLSPIFRDCGLYCDEIAVRCVSPSTLLVELSLNPQDIHVVHMDIEGYDTTMVCELLKLQGFAPAILSWEWIHNSPSETDSIIRYLTKIGYTVHSRSMDLWAVRS